MTILTDNNISVKEYDKISKYKDLLQKLRKCGTLKIISMRVIVEALGMIKKGTDKYINKIAGRHQK